MISFVLAYGCNVPAIASIRNIPSANERVLAGMSIPLIVCSARTVVIMALVTALLGPWWGLSIYVLSAIVVVLTLNLLYRQLRFSPAGLIMHMPPYRIPYLKPLLQKLYLRLKVFFTDAWPLLIAGTIVLELLAFYNVDSIINSAFSWLTSGLLGLPEQVTVPLLFGVLAKELALVMLAQSLNTDNLLTALSLGQIVVFTLFTTFYTPCISTIGMQLKMIGPRYTALSIAISVAIALTIAFIARLILM